MQNVAVALAETEFKAVSNRRAKCQGLLKAQGEGRSAVGTWLAS
jgi:hypothetical protein